LRILFLPFVACRCSADLQGVLQGSAASHSADKTIDPDRSTCADFVSAPRLNFGEYKGIALELLHSQADSGLGREQFVQLSR
jgi:hypothetical protein